MLVNCATFPLGSSGGNAQPLPEWGVAVGASRSFVDLAPRGQSWGKRPVVKKASSLSALGGLVYSTDAGRHCPDCNQPVGACICKQSVVPAGDGIARVRRETKGRGGKTVTTVSGVPLAEDALK